MSILLASSFVNFRRVLFLKFILLFYFNPYSMVIWFSAKNNMDEKYVKENYTNRSYLQRFKTYLTYITLVGSSNMLRIYF